MYIKKKTTKLQAFHARKQLVKLVELFEVEDNFTSNRIYEKWKKYKNGLKLWMFNYFTALSNENGDMVAKNIHLTSSV